MAPKKNRSRTKSASAQSPKPSANQTAASPAPQKPRKTPLRIPPILLEGDPPATPTTGGPGHRYSLAPSPPARHWGTAAAPGPLPEAYGTQQLLLAARDPHWLYAHWDLTHEQLASYNARADQHHLVLRLFLQTAAGTPLKEIHLHADSRHWFVHVGHGNTRYVAELGYYQPDRQWVSVSISKPTLTPPDTLSVDTSVQFAKIPFDVSFEQLLEEVKVAVGAHRPLIEAVQQLRESGHPQLPGSVQLSSVQWTPAQERALAEVVSLDTTRQVWIGSLEITELVRRQLEQRLAPPPGAAPVTPSSWFAAAVTSPAGDHAAPPSQPDFWFNLNAELVIYGATEPDARVTIGGRPIQLRRDGTFSFRFALPDGRYQLPAIAVSAQGTATRRANLQFSRSTDYHGHVGGHAQDPSLQPPPAA